MGQVGSRRARWGWTHGGRDCPAGARPWQRGMATPLKARKGLHRVPILYPGIMPTSQGPTRTRGDNGAIQPSM